MSPDHVSPAPTAQEAPKGILEVVKPLGKGDPASSLLAGHDILECSPWRNKLFEEVNNDCR